MNATTDLSTAAAVVKEKLRENKMTAEELRDHPFAYNKLNAEEKQVVHNLCVPAAAPAPSEPVAEVLTVKEPEPIMIAVEEPVVSVAVETPAAKSQTPIAVEQQAERRYFAFDLYDVNNPEHRFERRINHNGYYFIKRALAADSAAKMPAYWTQHGRYPYGVVEGNGRIHDACFPIENSANLTDAQWVNQARAFRDAADYDDLLYAEWPDLQSCSGELKSVPPFNSEWLPLAIRPHVEDIALRMSVPIDYPAICAISTLAGAVGRRAFVYPKAKDKGWFEPITISGAVIADSGKKKSPTWKALMRPLHELEKDWQREYSKRMAEYSSAVTAYERACKEAAKNKIECAVSEPVEPSKPKRLVLNDSTHEQMHVICKDNPQGLLFERDELSGLVAELDMVGREGMRGFFLDGMTGDSSKTVDRVGRDGGQADITFTVFGSFQPLLFRNVMADAVNIASGMMPRFHALVWPDNKDIPRVDEAENQEAKIRYRQVVRSLGSLEDKSVFLHFTPDAQQLFFQFQSWLDGQMDREQNPGKQSHLNKLDGGVAKIAALFQLVDAVSGIPSSEAMRVNLQSGESEIVTQPGILRGIVYIDEPHFQMAWDLVKYLVAHMHRVYDSKLEGIEYSKTRLLEHLKDGSIKDGMSARDIHHKDWAGLGRKVTTADSIEAALEELVDLGWVRLAVVKPGTAGPGRPTKRWNVNPEARATN